MPTKPKRPCSFPGCPELTHDRYCKEHQQKIDSEYNKKRPYKNLYNSTRWKNARKYYLEKNPLCIKCLSKGLIITAAVVDHIVPHKGNVQLFWDRTNWQALCKECHDRKTAKEDGRWKRSTE